MSEDEGTVVVCRRVTPDFEPTEGSTTTFCHECKAIVWISPAAVEFVAEHPDAQVNCLGCVGRKVDLDLEAFEALPNEEPALKEWLHSNRRKLAAYLRRAAKEQ